MSTFACTVSLEENISTLREFLISRATSSEIEETFTLLSGRRDIVYNIIKFLNDLEIEKMMDELFSKRRCNRTVMTNLVANVRDLKVFFRLLIEYQKYIDENISVRLNHIKSDEDKVESLKKVVFHDLRLWIIMSLENDEIKKSYQSEFETDEEILKFFKCLSDEKFKLSLIPKIESDIFRVQAILTFVTHDGYVRALELVCDPEEKARIVEKCEYDDIKCKFLREYTQRIPILYRNRILLSIKNRSMRNEAIFSNTSLRTGSIYCKDSVKEHKIYQAGEDELPSDMTFGIELEVVGNLAAVVLAYGNKPLGKYDVKEERSLDEGGVELSSHVMHYTKEDLNSIYRVCRFLFVNGLKSNCECGGHIHFGIDTLDSYYAWLLLFYIYSKAERIFFVISNREGEYPRDDVRKFAMPFSGKIVGMLDELKEVCTIDDVIEIAQGYTAHKKEAMNLENIGYRFDTIEFRMPNGEINPDEIVKNILLFGSLLRLAKKLSVLPLDENIYRLLKMLDHSKSDEETLEVLLALLFKEEKNKEVFRKRFKANYPLFLEYFDLDDSKFGSFSLEEGGLSF